MASANKKNGSDPQEDGSKPAAKQKRLVVKFPSPYESESTNMWGDPKAGSPPSSLPPVEEPDNLLDMRLAQLDRREGQGQNHSRQGAKCGPNLGHRDEGDLNQPKDPKQESEDKDITLPCWTTLPPGGEESERDSVDQCQETPQACSTSPQPVGEEADPGYQHQCQETPQACSTSLPPVGGQADPGYEHQCQETPQACSTSPPPVGEEADPGYQHQCQETPQPCSTSPPPVGGQADPEFDHLCRDIPQQYGTTPAPVVEEAEPAYGHLDQGIPGACSSSALPVGKTCKFHEEAVQELAPKPRTQLGEILGQESDAQGTGTVDSSPPPAPQHEEDTHEDEATCCIQLRRAMRWALKRARSFFRRRVPLDPGAQGPAQRTQRSRLLRRNRVHPQ